ncbi:YhbD family protein [Paenibacillus solisilvae]|uniref:YhbD family protein n=1 Tax=Paenibacillus solisilvae TaxID=2486751 RepID=A0ABW0VY01_9BACL
MERELISKKDLLETTGISYGQLYRWKRKQLIPEEWFIRKSTFTGQETFFPKELILQRIEKIISLKDDTSLDELVGKLTPQFEEMNITKAEVIERNIVTTILLDRFEDGTGGGEGIFSFERLLFLSAADKLLQAGEMSLAEAEQLVKTLTEHYKKLEGRSCDLIFMRKMGVSIFALLSVPGDFYCDDGVKIISRLSLTACIEELTMKLS